MQLKYDPNFRKNMRHYKANKINTYKQDIVYFKKKKKISVLNVSALRRNLKCTAADYGHSDHT